MDRKTIPPMTPFDEMTTPTAIRTLKLLIPYVPISARKFLGIFIKFQELKSTMAFFQTQETSFCHAAQSDNPPSMKDILDDISPFLRPEEAEMMHNMQNMMNMMEMMQTMQASANPGDSGDSGQDMMMNMLMGMISPEQREMFETYQTMFSDIADSSSPPDTSAPE